MKYRSRFTPMYHGAGWTTGLARLAMCCRDTSSTSPSSVYTNGTPAFASVAARAGADHSASAPRRPDATSVRACMKSRTTRRTSTDPPGNCSWIVCGCRQTGVRVNVQSSAVCPSARRTDSGPSRPLARDRPPSSTSRQRHIHAEVRPAIGGDEKRSLAPSCSGHAVVFLIDLSRRAGVAFGLRAGFRPVAGEHGTHGVVARRTVGRQRERPLAAAPLVDLDRPLVDEPVRGCRGRSGTHRARGQQPMPRACCDGGPP